MDKTYSTVSQQSRGLQKPLMRGWRKHDEKWELLGCMIIKFILLCLAGPSSTVKASAQTCGIMKPISIQPASKQWMWNDLKLDFIHFPYKVPQEQTTGTAGISKPPFRLWIPSKPSITGSGLSPFRNQPQSVRRRWISGVVNHPVHLGRGVANQG